MAPWCGAEGRIPPQPKPPEPHRFIHLVLPMVNGFVRRSQILAARPPAHKPRLGFGRSNLLFSLAPARYAHWQWPEKRQESHEQK